MGIPVMCPDFIVSIYTFTINKYGAIRFGLGAVKGLGSGPIEEIVKEREKKHFHSIFDFTKRVNLRLCTTRVFQSLVYAGGFDSLDRNVHRSQYFVQEEGSRSFLEMVVNFGKKYQEQLNSAQTSIFDDGSEVNLPEPEVPFCEAWSSVYRLNKEKEVVGVFLSGHPLDDFRIEIDSFCRGSIATLLELDKHEGRDLMIAAVVTQGEHRITRRGDGFGTLTIEDYNDSYRLNLFQEKYLKFKHFMEPGTFVIIKGRIEKNRWGKDLEFAVHGMELLQGLREKKAKSLDLKIPSKEVNDQMITNLQQLLLLAENKGKCRVNIMIYDALDEINVNLVSRSRLIKHTDELFQALKDMDVEYKLN